MTAVCCWGMVDLKAAAAGKDKAAAGVALALACSVAIAAECCSWRVGSVESGGSVVLGREGCGCGKARLMFEGVWTAVPGRDCTCSVA